RQPPLRHPRPGRTRLAAPSIGVEDRASPSPRPRRAAPEDAIGIQFDPMPPVKARAVGSACREPGDGHSEQRPQEPLLSRAAEGNANGPGPIRGDRIACPGSDTPTS
ncbi:unnamed protein product, partial [Phaeothamnion confervicola]